MTPGDLIERLGDTVDWAIAHRHPAGFFAGIYHQSSTMLYRGVKDGAFEDDARMEELIVRFGLKYLDAVDAYREGTSIPPAWRQAFNPEFTIMQGLIVPVTIHVVYDLGVAIADLATPLDASMRRDFLRIDAVSGGEHIPPHANALQHHVPAIRLPRRLTGDWCWSRLFTAHRKLAWRFACDLVDNPQDAQARQARQLAYTLREARWWARAVRPLAVGETKDVATVITALAGREDR